MKMNSEVDYYKEINEVKIVCDNMIVNNDFEYELKKCYYIESYEYEKDKVIVRKEVKRYCRRKSICEKWIIKVNIRTGIKKRSRIVKSNNDKEILKLNCEYVKLGRRRGKNSNKELRMRIEDMKRNGEEIKVLSM